MTQLDEKPAFEVFNPDRTKVFRIYASGRAEGFPEDCDCIVNRIPTIASQLTQPEDKFYRCPNTNDWIIEVHNPTGPNYRHAVTSHGDTTLEQVKSILLEWKQACIEDRNDAA